MASGSSGRNNSASKGFDFATTDDIVSSNPKSNAVVQRTIALNIDALGKSSFPRKACFPYFKVIKIVDSDQSKSELVAPTL
ncbi:hypothetical protein CsSME_00040224 [Camellia sinensis var. sinensis]